MVHRIVFPELSSVAASADFRRNAGHAPRNVLTAGSTATLGSTAGASAVRTLNLVNHSSYLSLGSLHLKSECLTAFNPIGRDSPVVGRLPVSGPGDYVQRESEAIVHVSSECKRLVRARNPKSFFDRDFPRSYATSIIWSPHPLAFEISGCHRSP